jgi:hypothetical protein
MAEASICQSDVCLNGACGIADVIGDTCVANSGPDVRRVFNANELAGGRFYVATGGRVTAIGLDTSFQHVTQHAYLAIYEDSATGPSTRVGNPQEVIITGGTVEAPVPHTPEDHLDLESGKSYWFMAVSDQIVFFEACSGGTTWAQGPLDTFGPPPPTLPTATTSITLEPSESQSPSIYIRIAHPAK